MDSVTFMYPPLMQHRYAILQAGLCIHFAGSQPPGSYIGTVL